MGLIHDINVYALNRGRLISGDVAGSVRLWELHSGARLATVDLRTHLTCLAADGRWSVDRFPYVEWPLCLTLI